MKVNMQKVSNDNHLYHITSVFNLEAIIKSKQFVGKNKFSMLHDGSEIQPLSLTKDKSLKYATNYFSALNVLVQFKEELNESKDIRDIEYDCSKLLQSSEGQHMFKYILGEEHGSQLLSEIHNNIFTKSKSEAEIINYAQSYLSNYEHEAEVISLAPVGLDMIKMVQFYSRTDDKIELDNIAKLISKLKGVKCSVINKKGYAIYTSAKGWFEPIINDSKED